VVQYGGGGKAIKRQTKAELKSNPPAMQTLERDPENVRRLSLIDFGDESGDGSGDGRGLGAAAAGGAVAAAWAGGGIVDLQLVVSKGAYNDTVVPEGYRRVQQNLNGGKRSARHVYLLYQTSDDYAALLKAKQRERRGRMVQWGAHDHENVEWTEDWRGDDEGNYGEAKGAVEAGEARQHERIVDLKLLVSTSPHKDDTHDQWRQKYPDYIVIPPNANPPLPPHHEHHEVASVGEEATFISAVQGRAVRLCFKRERVGHGATRVVDINVHFRHTAGAIDGNIDEGAVGLQAARRMSQLMEERLGLERHGDGVNDSTDSVDSTDSSASPLQSRRMLPEDMNSGCHTGEAHAHAHEYEAVPWVYLSYRKEAPTVSIAHMPQSMAECKLAQEVHQQRDMLRQWKKTQEEAAEAAKLNGFNDVANSLAAHSERGKGAGLIAGLAGAVTNVKDVLRRVRAQKEREEEKGRCKFQFVVAMQKGNKAQKGRADTAEVGRCTNAAEPGNYGFCCNHRDSGTKKLAATTLSLKQRRLLELVGTLQGASLQDAWAADGGGDAGEAARRRASLEAAQQHMLILPSPDTLALLEEEGEVGKEAGGEAGSGARTWTGGDAATLLANDIGAVGSSGAGGADYAPEMQLLLDAFFIASEELQSHGIRKSLSSPSARSPFASLPYSATVAAGATRVANAAASGREEAARKASPRQMLLTLRAQPEACAMLGLPAIGRPGQWTRRQLGALQLWSAAGKRMEWEEFEDFVRPSVQMWLEAKGAMQQQALEQTNHFQQGVSAAGGSNVSSLTNRTMPAPDDAPDGAPDGSLALSPRSARRVRLEARRMERRKRRSVREHKSLKHSMRVVMHWGLTLGRVSGAAGGGGTGSRARTRARRDGVAGDGSGGGSGSDADDSGDGSYQRNGTADEVWGGQQERAGGEGAYEGGVVDDLDEDMMGLINCIRVGRHLLLLQGKVQQLQAHALAMDQYQSHSAHSAHSAHHQRGKSCGLKCQCGHDSRADGGANGGGNRLPDTEPAEHGDDDHGRLFSRPLVPPLPPSSVRPPPAVWNTTGPGHPGPESAAAEAIGAAEAAIATARAVNSRRGELRRPSSADGNRSCSVAVKCWRKALLVVGFRRVHQLQRLATLTQRYPKLEALECVPYQYMLEHLSQLEIIFAPPASTIASEGNYQELVAKFTS
jgi:hypothetical protein